jgi:hypothetical protein
VDYRRIGWSTRTKARFRFTFSKHVLLEV